MSAEQKVVAESIGETEADLSTGQRAILRPPAFETGEFEELVSHRRDAADPESAELLAQQMAALRGGDRVVAVAAEEAGQGSEVAPAADEARDESPATKLRRAGGQLVDKLSGR